MSDKQKKAIDDIMDLFNLGGSEKEEESSDYSNTAETDSGSKPSFDEIISDIGDSIAEVGNATPALPLPEKKEAIVKEDKPKEDKKVEIKDDVEKKKVEENISAISDGDEEVNIDVDDIFRIPVQQKRNQNSKIVM